MPAAKLDEKLTEQLLREGKSQNDVVRAHEERGIAIHQSTISAAIRDGRVKVKSKYAPTRKAIPWKLLPEHRHHSAARMLRIQSRYEEGLPLSPSLERQRSNWIGGLLIENAVIHYDERTGFWRVARREGIDKGWVREPWIDDDGEYIPHPA